MPPDVLGGSFTGGEWAKLHLVDATLRTFFDRGGEQWSLSAPSQRVIDPVLSVDA
jgi:hypothetical protein